MPLKVRGAPALRHWLVVYMALLGSNVTAAPAISLTVGYQPYDTLSYSAAVIRHFQLWRKYLPPGSDVQFVPAAQGSVLVEHMLSGRVQIAYLGDMPALVAASKRDVAAITLVASIGFSKGQRCSLMLVRGNAPAFASAGEALKWMQGKVVAAPRGSCADRFLRYLLGSARITPAAIVDIAPDQIGSALRARKIDAAALWEPTASSIGDVVGTGMARLVATGYDYGLQDAGALAMRADFLSNHRAAASAWLKAELEAQQFVINPENSVQVARIVASQAPRISEWVAWYALYGMIPPDRGGTRIRDEKAFAFDPRLRAFLQQSYNYLWASRQVRSKELPQGAIDDSLAQEVLRERRLTDGLGSLVATPLSRAPADLRR